MNILYILLIIITLHVPSDVFNLEKYNINVIKNVFDSLMPKEYHLSVIKINRGIVLRLQGKLLMLKVGVFNVCVRNAEHSIIDFRFHNSFMKYNTL
jgi:hypothetical protein